MATGQLTPDLAPNGHDAAPLSAGSRAPSPVSAAALITAVSDTDPLADSEVVEAAVTEVASPPEVDAVEELSFAALSLRDSLDASPVAEASEAEEVDEIDVVAPSPRLVVDDNTAVEESDKEVEEDVVSELLEEVVESTSARLPSCGAGAAFTPRTNSTLKRMEVRIVCIAIVR